MGITIGLMLFGAGVILVIMAFFTQSDIGLVAGMILLGLSIVVLGIVSIMQIVNYIPKEQIRYSIVIENQTIYCDNYIDGWQSDESNDGAQQKIIYIPKHYYIEHGWIDKYILCSEPMLIVIPNGSELKIDGSMPLKNEPFIYKGAVGCK